MGQITGISWCDHTFNPWIGCTKISPACDGCYAAQLMGEGGRMGRVVWGEPGKGEGTRSRTAAANWRQPLKWDRSAEKAGERRFVFCASLADVFDNAVPTEWRRDLFELIYATPNLTWLLLTKRPSMMVKLFAEAMHLHPGGEAANWPFNAAIGTTVEDQIRADQNIPALLEAKAVLSPAFAFLSMEPLLGPVDLEDIPVGRLMRDDYVEFNALTGSGYYIENDDGDRGASASEFPTIDWVITGGETDQGSQKARPTRPNLVRSVRDQCADADVPFHHKQNGEWVSVSEVEGPQTAFFSWPEGDTVRRVGKKRSGRLLDGVLHDAMPELS